MHDTDQRAISEAARTLSRMHALLSLENLDIESYMLVSV